MDTAQFRILRSGPRRPRAACIAVLLALSGSACAPLSPEPSAAPEPKQEQLAPAPEPVYRPFPGDSLYELLVAEFAARRGEFEIALRNYLREAERTRDPEVAARATRMARYLGADRATLQAAVLWAELEPQLSEARFTAATELARAGRPAEAFDHMRAVHLQGGTSNFASIAAGALELPQEQQRAMLGELEALPPGNEVDVLVAEALLLQGLDRNDEALERVREAAALDPDNYQTVLIEAQIYQNLGEIERAHERIEKALAEQPDNTRLRLQYARILARSDIARSVEQFRILVERHPDDAEMRLSLALVYHESGQFDLMSEQLHALLAAGQQQNAARYYLGEDAERRGDDEAAIGYYLEVGPSQLFAAALTRAATIIVRTRGLNALGKTMAELRARWSDQALRLLLLESELRVENDDLDGAWALLSEALERQPAEPALLYARSMVSEKRRDIPALERDLREMLRQDPDNPLALNALGYSLTNLSDRHAEALELITRALELKPDDPAILDSYGWVQYRLGNLEAALVSLQEAFDRYPDHEVAAHLGEVLWKLGRTAEAREIWSKGLGGKPDSAIIRETLTRLGVSPPVEPAEAPSP